MKKQTVILFLFLSLFLSLFINIKIKSTKALTINEQSYAEGDNILDPSIVKWEYFDDEEMMGTLLGGNSLKYTYLKNGYDHLYISHYQDSPFRFSLYVKVSFYDIDFNYLGYITGSTKKQAIGGIMSYALEMDYSLYKDNAKFVMFYFETTEEVDFEKIKIGVYQDEFKTYKEFIKSNGLYDLSLASPVFNISYDHLLTTSELGAFIKAIDGYDGESVTLTFDLSMYEENYNKLGQYLVEVVAYDSSDNCQIGYFYLNVVDEKSPVISGPDELNLPAGYSIKNDDILSKYSSSDEFDGTLNVLFLEEYEFNYMGLNSNTYTLTSSDKSHNEVRKEITINFIDTLPPLIECLDEIHLGYTSRLNVDEVISEYVNISDNYDLVPTYSIIYDNYSEKIGYIGSFKVGIESSDIYGNKSSKEITITVEDKFPPIVYVDNYVLVTLDFIKLTSDDITEMLIETGELNRKEKYQMYVMLDTYTGHENEKGSYVYEVKYLKENGDEIEKTFLIDVSYDMYTIDPSIKLKNSNLKIAGIVVVFAIGIIGVSSITFIIIHTKKKNKEAK